MTLSCTIKCNAKYHIFPAIGVFRCISVYFAKLYPGGKLFYFIQVFVEESIRRAFFFMEPLENIGWICNYYVMKCYEYQGKENGKNFSRTKLQTQPCA